jgi:hypothetical protein
VNHLGGENQQTSLNHAQGYTIKAQPAGNTPSYLEPNRNRMQKPIEGLPATAENEGVGSLLAKNKPKSMLKNAD